MKRDRKMDRVRNKKFKKYGITLSEEYGMYIVRGGSGSSRSSFRSRRAALNWAHQYCKNQARLKS